MNRKLLICFGLTISISTFACSDDATTQADGGKKADGALEGGNVSPDAYPDLGVLPDVGKTVPCLSEWIDAVGAQDKVTTGAVTTTDKGGGLSETKIDATAGGMTVGHKNPWVYVSFSTGKRVDITDLQSRESTTWDMAFRRAAIRTNGGDSGAGKGALAIIADKKLAEVTAAPPASAFNTDEFIDAKCTVTRDPINNALTAFAGPTGLWYVYDSKTSQLTPKPDVYVVRLASDGSLVKLVVDSYYEGKVSANYTVSWSKL